MTTWTQSSRTRASFAALRPTLRLILQAMLGIAAATGAGAAFAQQDENPGDIIVQREITPRSAFDQVPVNQDPVAVRATTFPATTFNPAIAQVVSDADLTSAHGSSGLAPAGAMANGMQTITRILSGNATGSNVALGAGGMGQAGPGIGGTISQSVTGALAPLSTALTGALGGLK